MTNTIEVCLTPDLIHQHDLNGKIVVVVDIFRATSCIVSGMATGVKSIYPVAEVEECFALGKSGKIMAGERGGTKVEGFDLGNSPFEYMCESVKDKEITVSTTNGTQAIAKSLGADQILIGAFLNLTALKDYLTKSKKDIIVHCAGWKGTVNIEDTLFAGALIDALAETHASEGDSALLAHGLFLFNQKDLMAVANASSHAKRLCAFGVEKDLEFCLKIGEFDVIPAFEDGKITNLLV